MPHRPRLHGQTEEAVALAKSFGLSVERLASFTVHVEANKIATVTAVYELPLDVQQTLKFELVPVKEDADPQSP